MSKSCHLLALSMFLYLLICVLQVTNGHYGMLESEVRPGIIVQFQWTEVNRRNQINEDTKNRAYHLDHTLAVIMDPPFREWKNGTRARIQSLFCPSLTLAVKLKDLKLVQKPMNERSLSFSPTLRMYLFDGMHYGDDLNQIMSKELEIANNDHFDAVLTNGAIQRLSDSMPLRINIDKAQNWDEIPPGDFCDVHFDHFRCLDWFADVDLSTVSSSVQSEEIMFKLQESTKSSLARHVQHSRSSPSLWTQFRKSIDRLESEYPNATRLHQILQIQSGNMERNNEGDGSILDFDWLRPDLMSNQLVFQMLSFLHQWHHRKIYKVFQYRFNEWLSDLNKTVFHPVIALMQEECQSIRLQGRYPMTPNADHIMMLLSEMQFMVRLQRNSLRWMRQMEECLRIGHVMHTINRWGLLGKEQVTEESKVAIVFDGRKVNDPQRFISIVAEFASRCDRHNRTLIEVDQL